MSRFELGPVFFFVPDRFDFVDSLFFETISSVPGTGKYAPEAKYILFEVDFHPYFLLDGSFVQSELPVHFLKPTFVSDSSHLPNLDRCLKLILHSLY